MRVPTFSRHSSTDTAEEPQTATVTRPTEETTTRWVDNRDEQTLEMPRADETAETPARRQPCDRHARDRPAPPRVRRHG